MTEEEKIERDVTRDRFEEWASKDNRRLEGLEFEERTPGNNHFYEDDTTNQAYIGWCAAITALEGEGDILKSAAIAVGIVDRITAESPGLLERLKQVFIAENIAKTPGRPDPHLTALASFAKEVIEDAGPLRPEDVQEIAIKHGLIEEAFYVPWLSRIQKEEGRATRADDGATAPIATDRKMVIRIAECGGPATDVQRDHARNSGLYAEGDCVLIWINEGDLCEMQMDGRAKHFARAMEKARRT